MPPWIGPGPHDGDFDHEVVELARLQARQHATSARATRSGTRRWCRRARSCRRRAGLPRGMSASVNGLPRQSRSISSSAAAQRRQHAERQHVHLEQAEVVEIVLVPLDDRAILHGGVLDRHQLVERPSRDDEAADVLRQVAREARAARSTSSSSCCELRVVGIEAGLAHALGVDRGCPTIAWPFESRSTCAASSPSALADVAQRAARAVADDRGGERGAVAAVFAVDVLDDLLAPLVLEVDVDVGRLVALARDEALERAARRATGSTSVTPRQ